MAPDPWLQIQDVAIRKKHLKLFATDSVALLNHYNAVRAAYAGGMGEKPPTPAEVRAQMDQLIQRHVANALAEEAGALRQHTTATTSVHHAVPTLNTVTIVTGAVTHAVTGGGDPGAPSTTATYYAHPPSGTTAVTATGVSDFGSRLSENLTKPTVLVACISGAAAGFFGSSGTMRFVLATSGFTVPLLAYTALVE
jgi:hypothetical protein